jgi:hypothetical protein
MSKDTEATCLGLFLNFKGEKMHNKFITPRNNEFFIYYNGNIILCHKQTIELA